MNFSSISLWLWISPVNAACGSPPEAPDRGHGPIISSQTIRPPYAPSTTATYSCEPGYVLLPPRGELTCEGSSESWKPESAFCEGWSLLSFFIFFLCRGFFCVVVVKAWKVLQLCHQTDAGFAEYHCWRFFNLLKLLLQPLQLRCVECVIHHERDVREEQQYTYVARTSNNRVIMACELYWCLLLQCEALRTCRSGFSDRNTTDLLCWNINKQQKQASFGQHCHSFSFRWKTLKPVAREPH